MATEISRDMRSAGRDAKRHRQQKEKWSHGSRPLAGRIDPNYSWFTRSWENPALLNNDERVRPEIKKAWAFNPSMSQNINKELRTTSRYDIPQTHFRARLDARVQVHDPDNQTDYTTEDLLSPRHPQAVTDNFLYSFDSTKSPGEPLSLEMFVKTSPRATEKLVEKEYEVLDNNGDALKGRRARNNLRRRDQAPLEESSELAREDDGFELI